MAAVDLVILSSSPHDIPKRHVYSVPSSPNRDAPPPSLKRPYRHTLKSGSRAGEIPPGGSAGFCTASAFVKDNGTSLEPISVAKPKPSDATDIEAFAHLTDGEPEVAKAKGNAKRHHDTKAKPNKNQEQRKSRKTEDEETKPNKTDEHSQRSRKENNEPTKRKTPESSEMMQQMQLEKGNVTKPNIVPSVPETKGFRYPPGLNQTDRISKHFATNEHGASDRSHSVQPSDQTGEDEPTNPKYDGSGSGKENLTIVTTAELSLINETERSPKELSATSADLGREIPAADIEVTTAQSAVRAEEGQSVAKRRKVQSTKSVSPIKKVKQPSKSSRTITGLALAAFRNPEPEEQAETTLKDHFTPPVLIPEQKNETNKTTKKRSRSPKKALEGTKSKSGKSLKRSKSPVPKLLSPATAKRKMNRQDFLFCTSSQLVRDESPSFIRDLQHAIKLSDTESSLPIGAAIVGDNPASVIENRLVRAKRDLWLSATRVENGDTADLYFPEPFVAMPPLEDQNVQTASSDFVDIDALKTSSPRSSAIVPRALPGSSPPTLAAITPESGPQMSRLKLASAQHSRPKSTLMCALDEAGILKESPEDVQKASTTMRPFVGDSIDKPKKKSVEKTKVVSEKKVPKKVKSKDDTIVPKKPQGRPRKNPGEPPKTPKRSKKTKVKKDEASADVEANQATDAADVFIPIDEISDIEPCATPSPPRRKQPTIVQELELSPEVPSEAPRGKKSSSIPHIPTKPYQDELFPHLKLHLFKSITTAVKSLSRTCDPKIPTWHEKILLYDPIVLEDFTDWLNSGPLQDAGFTGFSANITVPVRKKEGEDAEGHNVYVDEMREKEVTVKAGEVDPWMVQKWCQDKSICCLWKGGLWGSVRLDY